MRNKTLQFLLLLVVACHAELVSASHPHYHILHTDSLLKTLNNEHLYSLPPATAAVSFPQPTDSAKNAEIRALKNDSIYHHIYRRAAVWSACIPGAGQIYNEVGYRRIQQKKHRAWWKVPLIYGGLGATGYYFYQNLATARALKAEWLYRNDGYGLLYPEYYDWSDDELLNGYQVSAFEILPGYDLAAKRRDMLAAGFIAIWGINVLEAYVDAHFVTFDVSEDLSMSWSPTILLYSTPGVALRLEFQ